MTDSEATLTRSAGSIRVNKLLALPHGAIHRLEGLRHEGCEVTYEVVARSLLREELRDVSVTGPHATVDLVWRSMRQDLGIKLTEVTPSA